MGGSTVGVRSVARYQKVAEPEKPTLPGYRFDGWYTDAGYTNKYDFNTPT